MKFECKYCGQHLEAPNELAGKELDCPNCQRAILIPPPPTGLAQAGIVSRPEPAPPPPRPAPHAVPPLEPPPRLVTPPPPVSPADTSYVIPLLSSLPAAPSAVPRVAPSPASAPRIAVDYAGIVKEVLQQHLHDGIYLAGAIPEKKEANARATCKIPAREKLVALIDCTVMGSAKNCLAFTGVNAYCHNDWAGKTAGTITIPYAEFSSRLFGDGGFKEVLLGNDQYLNVAGCSLSKDAVIAILIQIKIRISGEESPVLPPGSPVPDLGPLAQASFRCPQCRSASIQQETSVDGGVTAGAIVGGLLGGIVGAMVGGVVGKVVLGKQVIHYHCQACGFKWNGG